MPRVGSPGDSHDHGAPARPRRGPRAVAPDVAVETLREALGALADVRAPGEAEEPILAPRTRGAVFEWLGEIHAKDDLAAVGLRPRSTALLEGPPGTGKTTLAHHLAARLGIPLVCIGPENIHDMYVGQSERNAARLFQQLEQAAVPCVVLFDEFDSLAARRTGTPRSGGSEARLAVLTVLLRRIEQFNGILCAATNRAEDIDPAMWRRFHLQITVDLPGDDERYAILARYARPLDLGADALELLTERTRGASPALLRGLMEGLKRNLVLAARWRRDPGRPSQVFGRILASLRPPPEITGIPLWRGDDIVRSLDAITPWPPALPAAVGQAIGNSATVGATAGTGIAGDGAASNGAAEGNGTAGDGAAPPGGSA